MGKFKDAVGMNILGGMNSNTALFSTGLVCDTVSLLQVTYALPLPNKSTATIIITRCTTEENTVSKTCVRYLLHFCMDTHMILAVCMSLQLSDRETELKRFLF